MNPEIKNTDNVSLGEGELQLNANRTRTAQYENMTFYSKLDFADDITIEYVDPGVPDSPLSVSVTGRAVTVNLGTDSDGVISASYNQYIANMINADDAAKALLEANHLWGHRWHEPKPTGPITLSSASGIYKYDTANRIVATNTVTTGFGTAHGRLFMDTLLPREVEYYRMGGVEQKNIDLFGNLRRRGTGSADDVANIIDGMWRVQMTASESGQSQKTAYLNVLQATHDTIEIPDDTMLFQGPGLLGAAVAGNLALFNPSEDVIATGSLEVPSGVHWEYRVLISDLDPNAQYDVTLGSTSFTDRASEQGTLFRKNVSLATGNTISVRKTGAPVDSTPPVISTLQTRNVRVTSAEVSYSTNEPADSRIDYGTTTSYSSTKSSAALTKSHRFAVTNLSPNTTYHFRVTSSDASGNAASSEDRTFTTLDPSSNLPPNVSAGSDVTVTFPDAASLSGTATDDGLPNGTLTILWSKVSGPGEVVFTDNAATHTNASFSQEGIYILRLEADDGEKQSNDDVEITVNKPPPASALVAYWTFDEGSGDIAWDSSSNRNNGILINGPQWVPQGKLGGALQFDGQDDYVEVAGDMTLAPAKVTFSVWVKPAPMVLGGILKRGGGASSASLRFRYDHGKIYTHIREIGYATGRFYSVGTVPIGEWSHVAATWDNAMMRVYINGVESGNQVFAGTGFNGATANLLIGINGTDDANTDSFNGIIDDLCLYNRPLTPEEIAVLASGNLCSAVINQPPTIDSFTNTAVDRSSSAGIQVYPEDPVTFSATTSDPDGDTIDWAWWSKKGSDTAVQESNGQNTINDLSFTFPEGSEGSSYLFTLNVSDGEEAVSDSVTMTVIEKPPVDAPNTAPTVNAGPDQTITLPSTATLDGTVIDDGLPNPPALVATTWTKDKGPGTVTFINDSATDTTATFSQAGDYILTLTADDSQLSDSDTVTITALPEPEPDPDPVDLCFQVKLSNRDRKEKDHDLARAKVAITDEATDTVIHDTIAAMNATGEMHLTDVPNIEPTGSYRVILRPEGYLRRMLTNQTSLDQTCRDAGTALAGDTDEDDDIDIADLVTAVRHFLAGDNAFLLAAFPGGFELGDLVEIIKHYVLNR